MASKHVSRTVLICLTTLYSAIFIILSIWQYHKTYSLKQEYLYESEKLHMLEKHYEEETILVRTYVLETYYDLSDRHLYRTMYRQNL